MLTLLRWMAVALTLLIGASVVSPEVSAQLNRVSPAQIICSAGRIIVGGTPTTCAAAPDLTFGDLTVDSLTSSGAVTATRSALGTTSTDGVILTNTTAAAAGAQQISPRLRLTGQGWKTDATAASQTVDWIIENLPVQGAAAPTTNLLFKSQVNGGGYTTRYTFNSAGTLALTRLEGNGTMLALAYDTGDRFNLTATGLIATGTGWQIGSTAAGGVALVNIAGIDVNGAGGYYRVGGDSIIINTAPTVSTGCTGEAMVWNRGTASFEADVGTTCAGVSTITFTLPSSGNGWMCKASNVTTAARDVEATAWAATTVTFTNFVRTTGVAGDWTDGDNVRVMCVSGGG